MNKAALVVMTALAASSASAQTARRYYNELLKDNGLNEYMDEYVCFPDKDLGTFMVVAKTTDMRRAMEGHHQTGTLPPTGYLVTESYDKGVGNGATFMEPVSASDPDEGWFVEFKTPFHGKMLFKVNWATGRYRSLVYALDSNKYLPAAEVDGRCQLIHPAAESPAQ